MLKKDVASIPITRKSLTIMARSVKMAAAREYKNSNFSVLSSLIIRERKSGEII